MRHLLIASTFIMALGGLAGPGCGSDSTGEPTSTEDTLVDDVDSDKADSKANPVGTFKIVNAKTPTVNDLDMIVLKTDKTYFAYYARNGQPEEGTYKFAKSSQNGDRYVTLMHLTSTWPIMFKFSGTTLELSSTNTMTDGSPHWLKYERADEAWCQAVEDCSLQSLPQPKCPGEWTCESDACKYSECNTAN